MVSHGWGHLGVCVMDAEGDDEGMGVLDNVVHMGNTEVVCCLVLPEKVSSVYQWFASYIYIYLYVI